MDIVIGMRGQAQAGAQGVVVTLNRGEAAAADIDAFAKAQIRLLTVIEVAAQLQTEQVLDQRAADIGAGRALRAELAVFLEGVPQADRAGPLG